MSEEKKKMAEEVDEQDDERDERERAEEKAPAKPSGPVGPNVVFNRGIRAWIAVTAAAVAGSIAFLPIPGLDKPLGSLTLGGAQVTMMLIPALAVAAAALWAVFKFLGGTIDYGKPGQGRWVRLSGYAGVGFFAVFAAVQAHRALLFALPSESRLLSQIWAGAFIGQPITLRPIVFVAIAACGLLMLVYHFFMNREKWVEFLVETQSELRKVSWPPTKEWVGSSFVVVIVMVFVSFFVFFVDGGLSRLLQALRIGF
jgi:preprotein translocase SecE subunit